MSTSIISEFLFHDVIGSLATSLATYWEETMDRNKMKVHLKYQMRCHTLLSFLNVPIDSFLMYLYHQKFKKKSFHEGILELKHFGNLNILHDSGLPYVLHGLYELYSYLYIYFPEKVLCLYRFFKRDIFVTFHC